MKPLDVFLITVTSRVNGDFTCSVTYDTDSMTSKIVFQVLNGDFIPRNNGRRKNNRISRTNCKLLVSFVCGARKCGEFFSLCACHHNQDFVRRIFVDIFDWDKCAFLWFKYSCQFTYFHIGLQRSTVKCNFFAERFSNLYYLHQSGNG